MKIINNNDDIRNNPNYICLGNNRYIKKVLYEEIITRINKETIGDNNDTKRIYNESFS